ncbi:MAG: hypothetical protein ACO3IB_03930 [Phycisphaerales bacterium]
MRSAASFTDVTTPDASMVRTVSTALTLIDSNRAFATLIACSDWMLPSAQHACLARSNSTS